MRNKVGRFASGNPGSLDWTSSCIWDRRSSLEGVTLDVAGIHEPPNSILRPTEEKGVYEAEGGIVMDIFKLLQLKLNFSYRIIPPP